LSQIALSYALKWELEEIKDGQNLASKIFANVLHKKKRRTESNIFKKS